MRQMSFEERMIKSCKKCIKNKFQDKMKKTTHHNKTKAINSNNKANKNPFLRTCQRTEKELVPNSLNEANITWMQNLKRLLQGRKINGHSLS